MKSIKIALCSLTIINAIIYCIFRPTHCRMCDYNYRVVVATR